MALLLSNPMAPSRSSNPMETRQLTIIGYPSACQHVHQTWSTREHHMPISSISLVQCPPVQPSQPSSCTRDRTRWLEKLSQSHAIAISPSHPLASGVIIPMG
ncbi:hypothetical protein SLE2022_077160 [Rubroshorea leprosula]